MPPSGGTTVGARSGGAAVAAVRPVQHRSRSAAAQHRDRPPHLLPPPGCCYGGDGACIEQHRVPEADAARQPVIAEEQAEGMEAGSVPRRPLSQAEQRVPPARA